MECIDLLDDSDDDLPLGLPYMKPVVNLPISSTNSCDLVEIGDDDNSDKTEVYSNSSSLPDLDTDFDHVNRFEGNQCPASENNLSVHLNSSFEESDRATYTKLQSDGRKHQTVDPQQTKVSGKNQLALKKKEEKERQALEKKRKLAIKAAEREAKRAAQPGECHRHMLLEVDERFKESSIGVSLEAACLANGVSMKYVTPDVQNIIIFKRKVFQTDLGCYHYHKEPNLAMILSMNEAADLIQGTGRSKSLPSLIKEIIQNFQCKLTVVMLGCDKYFRIKRSRGNQGSDHSGTQHKKRKHDIKISRLDYEKALLEIQMDSDTVFIEQDTEEDVAKTILRINKSIAEAPIKRDKYIKEAMAVKTSGLKIGNDGKGFKQIWQRMLQECKNISADVACAIITEYPSPALLYQAYHQRSETQAENLLQDIEVRRGGSVVQTKRKVGKETSRRIYELLMEENFCHIIT